MAEGPQRRMQKKSGITWDREVDARGLICPLPVLRARKHLSQMEQGAVLRLLADDPVAVVDVPHFCAEAGHDFLCMEEVDGAQSYLIRRG
ncbi:MAG: sulfurtransferase TusA family protein [Rhodosalinus sp.]